jgi:hypothetical protein
VGSGQWAVGSGQWAVGSGQWAVGSGQWAVGSGQWAVADFRMIKRPVHCTDFRRPSRQRLPGI